MAESVLKVTARTGAGKGVARSLRRAGRIPGVVYGRGVEAVNVSLDPKELKAAVATEAGWNTLITLKGDGPFNGKIVVLKDLAVEPIRRDLLHADFHIIDLKKKGHFMVPVVPVGKSAGEKLGGSLQVIRHELEVVCLPSAVPNAIEIDVNNLGIGDVVHIEDIAPPAGVEFPHEVNFTVITVIGHKAEEGEGGAEAASAAS